MPASFVPPSLSYECDLSQIPVGVELEETVHAAERQGLRKLLRELVSKLVSLDHLVHADLAFLCRLM